MRLYGEIIPEFSEGIIDHTGAQTMLYLTCTTITSVDLAYYGVSHAKDWVSVDCGTRRCYSFKYPKTFSHCHFWPKKCEEFLWFKLSINGHVKMLQFHM